MRSFFVYSICMMPWSWIFGIMLNHLAEKTDWYPLISSQVFNKNEKIYRWVGLDIFKWVVINTPFRYFNQKIKIKSRPTIDDIEQLRKDMIFSEISHLFGFLLILPFVIALVTLYSNFLFGSILFIVNLAFNLYPSLLQQRNKQRVERYLLEVKQNPSHQCTRGEELA